VVLRFLVRPPNALPSMSPMLIMPGARHAGNLEASACRRPLSGTSISISLSSSSLARSFLRKLSRVALAVAPTSASSTRSSALCCALALHVLALLVAQQADAGLDEVAHDLLDVAADIADLGELGRLDLDERRPASLARRRAISVLPTPVGPIIRMFLGVTSSRSRRLELLAAPAVAQRDGHGALGVLLADDEAVEFGNDLAGDGWYRASKSSWHCASSPVWPDRNLAVAGDHHLVPLAHEWATPGDRLTFGGNQARNR
jgi:hypothetical protein